MYIYKSKQIPTRPLKQNNQQPKHVSYFHRAMATDIAIIPIQ